MRITAISAAAGAVAVAGLSATGVAGAMPGDHPGYDQYCTPGQVDVSLSPPDSAMGKSGGEVRFRAKPGTTCLLGGAPVLTFRDASGQRLDIPGQYPTDRGEQVVVDDQHQAVSSYSFPRVDGRTGDQLRGPVPESVTVALPVPGNGTTVQLPWENHVEVPGPVDVNPVLSR